MPDTTSQDGTVEVAPSGADSNNPDFFISDQEIDLMDNKEEASEVTEPVEAEKDTDEEYVDPELAKLDQQSDEEDDEPEEEPEVKAEEQAEDKEYKDGQFLPDNGKVKLDDGSIITVGELRRNNLFQSDYSKKTESLKEEVQAFETQRQEFQEVAQQFAQQRDFLEQMAGSMIPPEPHPLLADVNSEHYNPQQYLNQQRAYSEAVQQYQQFEGWRAQEAERQQQEQSQAMALWAEQQKSALLERMPDLIEPKAMNAFNADKAKYAEFYGVPVEEFTQPMAAQAEHVLRDAMRYRKIVEKSAAKKTSSTKTSTAPIIKGRQKPSTKQKSVRGKAERLQRLQSDGSMESAVAALADIDFD
jgi:hypothetical protein